MPDAWRVSVEQTFKTKNPTTETVLEELELHSPRYVEQTLGRARSAFLEWSRTSLGARSRLLRALAARLREERATLARHAVLEGQAHHAGARRGRKVRPRV